MQTALHVNFKLSITGEAIGLFDDSKKLVDFVVFGKQNEDISSGRQPDGGAEWHFFNIPTPGTTNNTAAYLKARVPEFSLKSGYYTVDQDLAITTDEPGTTIRYTLNGDEPDESSPVYADPVILKSRVGEANLFSEIRTTLDPYHWLPDWVPPAGEVFKANVVRARVYKSGYEPSDIITLTCFIDADMLQRYATLPVISIISDRKHLFDYQTGIYVPGYTHITGQESSGNYFQDWEKPAHIAYFEPGGQLGFAQDVGIKIQGDTSPSSPQKGLHIIARSDYGKNRIAYPIFKDDPSKAKELTEFKRFIIRAWGSLITGSLFNDAYAHRLMATSELDIQAYQPAIVFINGEYWGIHALREANKNSWYYQYHYDIDREDPGFDLLQHTLNNGQPYANVDE
ncbi:MAG: chitobiase/beta-hexosaminidase C-terminal domain-containing protein, partial [Bacteroidales bacterium]|nr:chitobiase/beta-hexosaminidase C-terminal domain-containing protein [Bacteroidales bacterium]